MTTSTQARNDAGSSATIVVNAWSAPAEPPMTTTSFRGMGRLCVSESLPLVCMRHMCQALARAGRSGSLSLLASERGRPRPEVQDGSLEAADRKTDHKAAALSDAVAGHGDRAAVKLDEASHEREAEAQAARLRRVVAGGDLRVRLEDALKLIARNADAGVADRHGRALRVERAFDRHAAACGRELGRVLDQIRKDLREPLRITVDDSRHLRQFDRHLELPLLDFRPARVHGFGHD